MKIKKVGLTIKKNILLYFAIISIVLLLVSSIFNIKNKLQPQDKFNIFVAGSITNEEKLKENIKAYNNDIKEINIFSMLPNDLYFNMYFSTTGIIDSDILIIPKNALSDIKVAECFYESKSADSYIYNNKSYGYLIHSEAYSNGFFDEFITYNDDEYYMFISLGTIHYGKKDNFINKLLEVIYEEK